MKTHSILIASIMAFGLTFAAAAQTAGQDLKNAGTETKDATKDAVKGTGKAVKKGARKTKNGVKHAANATASETEKGAAKVKQKTE